MRLCPDKGGDAMRKYLVLNGSRSTSVLNTNPFINFCLKPRDSKPTKDKTTTVHSISIAHILKTHDIIVKYIVHVIPSIVDTFFKYIFETRREVAAKNGPFYFGQDVIVALREAML